MRIAVLQIAQLCGTRAGRLRGNLRRAGLELVTRKCQVYLPPTITEEAVSARIKKLCATRHLPHDTRMESLGVMFGASDAVTAHCELAVTASEHFFECVQHPHMPKQTATLLLRTAPSLVWVTSRAPLTRTCCSHQRGGSTSSLCRRSYASSGKLL